MKILYIFPHPDDESFGPAPAISKQRRDGNEVHLLTLTRGEATKQRHKLGVDKEEMGEIRYKEMQCVAKVLGLTELNVLNWPDDHLKELDPMLLENSIERYIHRVRPDVIVTYAVHGISGFNDHLVSHAIVKRLFCEMRRKRLDYPRRLGLFTLDELQVEQDWHNLKTSPKDDIDTIVQTDQEDMDAFNKALDCYESYKEVIDKSRVREQISGNVAFELFQEDFNPPLEDLFDELKTENESHYSS